MRDLRRIARDISFFVNGIPGTRFRGFGPDQVFFDQEGKYIYLPELRMPDNVRPLVSPLLVSIPEGYGYGVPFRDAFIGSNVRTVGGRRPSRMFDGFERLLPAGNSENGRRELARRLRYPRVPPPLAYICVHSRRDVSLWEFVEQIVTYLNNPVG